MLITRTLPELRAGRDALGPVVLVPTMGALHAGHLALVKAARAAGGKVAASIFVNPLQFGPAEDFARYPRDEAGDLAKLEAAGCEIVWLPEAATMYPPQAASTVTVAGPATRWEGELRPGHFAGVATVVAKLFGQVQPRAACFGEKDWQQIRVISRMVEDLSLPVAIIPVATVREPDGLALSSRNRFLQPAERRAAPALYAALRDSARRLAAGETAAAALGAGRYELRRAGLRIDYFALVDAASLEPLEGPVAPGGAARLLAAARCGSVRLLDNIAIG
jgi:pantoate--beta-alanine ligase